jgi:hypothetical protein
MPSFPISGDFDSVTGLFLDSSGQSSPGTSLTSPNLFNPLGHSTGCLIPAIQHSAFTADLFFSIQPLIAANSSFGSDCRRPNAMDEDRHRRLCPAIDAVRYRSVSFYPNEVGRRTGPRRCRRPRAAVHGTYRRRFAAHEVRFGSRGFGHWDLTRRTGRNAQNKTDDGWRSE